MNDPISMLLIMRHWHDHAHENQQTCIRTVPDYIQRIPMPMHIQLNLIWFKITFFWVIYFPMSLTFLSLLFPTFLVGVSFPTFPLILQTNNVKSLESKYIFQDFYFEILRNPASSIYVNTELVRESCYVLYHLQIIWSVVQALLNANQLAILKEYLK